MRTFLITGWLLLLGGIVVALFWYNDWQYSLPTPVPREYRPVEPGSVISFKGELSARSKKPLFLHFFNPACPCSRFNIPYFKLLAKRYGDRADFRVVALSSRKYTRMEIQEKFGDSIPVYTDSSLAVACGVYSTPQAVILDSSGKLYYRGNYNRSRYCTDNKTNYAEMALNNLLDGKQDKIKDSLALRSYGCRLPRCTR